MTSARTYLQSIAPKEKTRPKPGFLVSALHAGVAAGPGAARAARTTLSWSAWP